MRRRAFHASLWHDADAPVELLDALWEDPDRLVATAQSLKEGDRCTVVRIDHEGRPVVLKRYNLRGPMHTSVHAVMRSRAAWSLLNAHRVRRGGLLTPRPLACLETRRGVLRARSFLLTDFIAGPTLLDLVGAGGVASDRLERLATSFAGIWQKLGELRLGHGDMKAANFIVGDDDRLWMIDLDGMRRYPPAYAEPLLQRQRAKDRERFMQNWTTSPEVREAFEHLIT